MMTRRGTRTWTLAVGVLCAALGGACGGDSGGSGGDADGSADGSASDGTDRDGTDADGTDADGTGGDGAGDGSAADGSAGDGGAGDGSDAPDVPALPFPDSGVSAKVDGTEITYTNMVLLPNLNGDRLQFEATADNYLSKWRLFVPNEVGTHACDDDTEVTVLQLIDVGNGVPGGVGSGTGSCTIELLHAADGVYYGTFTAMLEASDASGTLRNVTEGVFYYSAYSRPNGAAGLPEAGGVTFKVNGEAWTYETANPFVFETYAGMTAIPSDRRSPGSPIGIQLQSVPNEVGRHACAEGPAYRAVNVWFYWKNVYYYAGNRQAENPDGPAGSSCTIDVSSVGTLDGNAYHGTFAGTFEGTFVSDDGSKSVTVTEGQFKLVQP